MADMYNEQQASKKKYLVPLIVLLLCAVSLTGAGYAYSSSVSDSGTVTSDYVMINLYKDTHTDATDTTPASDVKGDAISALDAVELDWTSTTVANVTTWSCTSSTSYYFVALDAANSSVTSINVASVTVKLYTNEACTDEYTDDIITVSTDGVAAGTTLNAAGSVLKITVSGPSSTTTAPTSGVTSLYMKVFVQSVDA